MRLQRHRDQLHLVASPPCQRDDCVALSVPVVSWVGCIFDGLAEDDLKPLAHALDASGVAVKAWS